jgi:sugar phosphate isomerase/epimerase
VNAPKRALKKGYMLGTFPQSKALSLKEKFKLLKAAGFDGVEPASHFDRDEILKAQDASGIEIASMSCGGYTRLFSSPAAAERKKRFGRSALLARKRQGLRREIRFGCAGRRG